MTKKKTTKKQIKEKPKEKILTADDLANNDNEKLMIIIGGIIALTIMIISIAYIIDNLVSSIILLISTIIITEISSYFVLKYYTNWYKYTKIDKWGSLVIKLMSVTWGLLGVVVLGFTIALIVLIVSLIIGFIKYINIYGRMIMLYFLATLLIICIYMLIMELNHKWFNKYLKKNK